MPELDLRLDFRLDRARLDRVRHGATIVPTSPAVFRVTGAGALACMQGLLTNDLEKPGDGSLVYGALLTPKGMIVVDTWVLRQGDALTLIMPPSGHAAALELFTRQLPPRLARTTDLTGQSAVAWVLGAHGFQVLAKSGVGMPEAAGRVVSVGGELSPVAIALAPESAPFVAVALGLAPAVEPVVARLEAAGAVPGEERDLHAARVLCGWPALGFEIDERTLPQEVRYDEIGGVSYTKGCYTGQETVARLHFRGHTNRELRGLRWADGEPLDGRAVVHGEKDVGSVRTTLTLEDRVLGLGVLRREIAPGESVMAGGRRARVVALPFGADEVDG
jgi:folate-binding protein YgfZ